MILNKKKKESILEIDLTGPQGNAFYLLGVANDLSKFFNFDSKNIQKEMMESDYENLIQVFDKYFGFAVTLYR